MGGVAFLNNSHLLLMTSFQDDRAKPRKNAKQLRSSETVAIIIEAAARILESKSYTAFTTNAIARMAGVSIGTLYQYFPNKEAVIGALLGRETAQLLSSAETALRRPAAEEALLNLISAAVEHQFRRPRLALLLDLEEARMPLDNVTQRVSAGVIQIVLQILERLAPPVQGEGIVAARDIVAIIKGIVDAAGANGESDLLHVTWRVRCAVFGYLRANREMREL